MNRYIGIDKDISELTQVVKLQGDYRIDDELDLFTIKKRSHELPFTNKRLLKKENDGYVSLPCWLSGCRLTAA